MPAPESWMRTSTRPCAIAGGDAHAGRSAAVHGVLGIEQEVEEDLLQLALVAEDAGKVAAQSRFRRGSGGFELMLEQGERYREDSWLRSTR